MPCDLGDRNCCLKWPAKPKLWRRWYFRQEVHLKPSPSQGGMQIFLHLGSEMVAGTESHRTLLLFRQTLSYVSYPAIDI
jgi:hypothetical protein